MNSLLAPKAATYVAYWLAVADDTVISATDEEIGADLGLRADTVYRSLLELKSIGALNFSRANHFTSKRHIALMDDHWLWTAVREGSR